MAEGNHAEDETSIFSDWIDSNYEKFTSIGILAHYLFILRNYR